ncbi:nitroreductase family protein [Pseudorhodobacter ferrugineus]|uniref:nitroreductase family protein n=1 Tax=Pseudorhodobacter ferrugineus TaxID=77008 RepID=UPI0003B4F9BF|nr:nitroreductase family protein [Pseudorhodobacter ferrugineus]
MAQTDITATNFLQTRRSVPAKMLGLPVPNRAALMPLLTAALRVPDHGKLEPWRLLVLEKGALARIATLATARAATLGYDAEKTAKGSAQFETGNLAVAVISSPKPSDKIPAVEQVYSAGAVCLSLLNAALAAGWGANWLSGWPSHDAGFTNAAFGTAPHETVAGIIHIGTPTNMPPERPRPDLGAVVEWVAQ